MTEKIESRKSGMMTGPAWIIASSMEVVFGKSGAACGAAGSCAKRGVALASATSIGKMRFIP